MLQTCGTSINPVSLIVVVNGSTSSVCARSSVLTAGQWCGDHILNYGE
jgi:hypothetical protein